MAERNSHRALIFAVVMAAFCNSGVCEPSPSAVLEQFISAPLMRGDVCSQAKLDGVDYRNLLKRVAKKDEGALVAIFDYTHDGHLTGEAAESNISVLAALLRIWGDVDFSRVIKSVPLRVRESAGIALIEEMPEKELQSTFPQTYKYTRSKKRNREWLRKRKEIKAACCGAYFLSDDKVLLHQITRTYNMWKASCFAHCG